MEAKPMQRFILTGAPGAGKTVLLRQLELEGFGVLEEAATDLIALKQSGGIQEPWTDPGFPGEVVSLQRLRRLRAAHLPDKLQFHDRSAICTAALAVYLGYPVSAALTREIERIKAESFYQNRVLFIRNLGFIVHTEARRISFEETLRFERIHEETYRKFGFELAYVESGTVADRVAAIRRIANSSEENGVAR